MRNKAHDLTGWSFSSTDRILPDANFWILVFGPAASVANPDQRVRKYSGALEAMLRHKVSMFIDVTIMSEFVNTLARLEFNANFSGKGYQASEFKRFRNSADFVPTAKMIEREFGKILKISNRLDHPFSSWDLTALLGAFGKGGEDFNDQLIVEITKSYDLKLLTDDGDMTNGGVDVITANLNLLRNCPA
jgi:hypothetical protein